MNCELCGGNIRGEAQAVNIDGGLFRVCNSCARLGTPARLPKKPVARTFTTSSNPGFARAPRGPAPPRPPSPPSADFGDQEVELRSDYNHVIKNARELLGLSQEDLGRKINEKPSMISHLEIGSMKPDDQLARKLEHFLKVELFVPVEEEAGA